MSRRIQFATLAALIACGFGLLLRYETARYITTGIASSCTVSEEIDCDAVQTSEYAKLLGMSVSLWAAAGSAALAVLLLLVPRFGRAMLMPAGLFALLNALVSATYLAISLFVLGRNCLYCNAIQLMSIVAGVLVVPVAWRARGAGLQARPFGAAALAGSMTLLLAVLGEAYADAHTRLGQLREDTGDANMRVEVSDAMLIGDPEKAPSNSFLVYFDFGCPRCRECYRMATKLHRESPDRVHFIFKHWPLDRDCNKTLHRTVHHGSCGAARAGQASVRVGRESEAMARLFKADSFVPSDLRAMGPSWGIAADEWEALLASPEIADDVRRDVEEGNRLDLAGVPAVFRNGRRVLEMRLLPK
jgi:uncharacterized membrane protein